MQLVAHLVGPWERALSGRIAQGTGGHWSVSDGPPPSASNARGSRLDGQYGNGTVLCDVASFVFVTRGKDYHLLDHPLIKARLHLPPDQFQQRPRSVRWCAAPTIAPRSRWDLRGCPAVGLWLRIRAS